MENYERIKKKHLVAFLENYIVPRGPKRRKLSIHAVGHAIKESGGLSSCGTPIAALSTWRTASQMDKTAEDVKQWLVDHPMFI